MKDLFSRIRRWTTDRLNQIEVWVVRYTPGAGKDWFSPLQHALVTVLGLKPFPFGPFGIALFFWFGIPWLWLAASTWTWRWYFRRERREHGGSIPWRLDPILDVVVAGLALDALWWWLLK